MPSSRTSAEIIVKARQLSDTEQFGTGPQLIGDTEALGRVNDSLANFWETMCARDAEELLSQRVTLTGPGTSGTVDFPADFYKLIGLWVLADDGRYRRVRRLPLDAIDDYHDGRVDIPTHYLLRGRANGLHENTVSPELFPSPGTVARTYRLDYVPDAPLLTDADGATPSIELPNRWWRWIELDCAIGFLAKEESDPSQLLEMRARVEQGILRSASDMDYSEAPTIQDVRGITRRRRPVRGLGKDWII